MHRVVCLIDGFNLYHAIDKMRREEYKWCNYRKLAKQFIKPYQNLTHVLYFTAYAFWNPGRVERHEKFVAALQGSGVVAVLGRFKEVTRYCCECKRHYIAHEEKETDVNLAAHLLHLAHLDQFDTALIISADSDYASAIALTRKHFPQKKIGVVFPVGQKQSDKLASVASFVLYMKPHHIKNSLLPKTINLKDGRAIHCPDKYTSS